MDINSNIIYENIIFNNRFSKAPRYIESFETKFAHHIIKKYILASASTDIKTGINDESNVKLTMDGVMSQIFNDRKKQTLSPKEVLQQEYDEIVKADNEYNENIDKYPTGLTPYGYPNELRCNFIIYSRHRFERCSCKINDDCDEGMYCVRHMTEDNIYASEYELQLMDLESDNES